MVEYHLTI